MRYTEPVLSKTTFAMFSLAVTIAVGCTRSGPEPWQEATASPDACVEPCVTTDDASVGPGDATVTLDASVDTPVVTDASVDAPKPDAGCGRATFRCPEGSACQGDEDCVGACAYDGRCVATPSCRVRLGGDTCGKGEVGEPGAVHESCCRTLLVPGYADVRRPGKAVHLDKYEVTAGRMRAFVEDITRRMNGKPNVRGWLAANRPPAWQDDWARFMPTSNTGDLLTIHRLLLGDPRHDGEANPGPGVIVPPPTDQAVDVGLDSQFGGQVYADVHGNNCAVYPGAYGFPTYHYPADVLARDGQLPRAATRDQLDVKSLNCVTNAMLVAFCHWDGGELATDEVLDFVTGAANAKDSVSGCGTQYDNHGELLGNVFTHTVQAGGRCAPVGSVNATFDGGDTLPVPGSHLNVHVYHHPDLGNQTHDKAWQVAAPGRVTADAVRVRPGDEPWMDLHGNLNETVYSPRTGRFGLRNRGIGYGSSRSDLNVTLMPGEAILRVQRPEVKSALAGGRCMRFK